MSIFNTTESNSSQPNTTEDSHENTSSWVPYALPIFTIGIFILLAISFVNRRMRMNHKRQAQKDLIERNISVKSKRLKCIMHKNMPLEQLAAIRKNPHQANSVGIFSYINYGMDISRSPSFDYLCSSQPNENLSETIQQQQRELHLIQCPNCRYIGHSNGPQGNKSTENVIIIQPGQAQVKSSLHAVADHNTADCLVKKDTYFNHVHSHDKVNGYLGKDRPSEALSCNRLPPSYANMVSTGDIQDYITKEESESTNQIETACRDSPSDIKNQPRVLDDDDFDERDNSDNSDFRDSVLSPTFSNLNLPIEEITDDTYRGVTIADVNHSDIFSERL